MDRKIIIESLAMDLKRITMGLQRGSQTMAMRFKEEALERVTELENLKSDDYLNKLIKGIKRVLFLDEERLAEDSLMYSTLFQNYAQKII